jgi:hypothetical protein
MHTKLSPPSVPIIVPELGNPLSVQFLLDQFQQLHGIIIIWKNVRHVRIFSKTIFIPPAGQFEEIEIAVEVMHPIISPSIVWILRGLSRHTVYIKSVAIPGSVEARDFMATDGHFRKENGTRYAAPDCARVKDSGDFLERLKT